MTDYDLAAFTRDAIAARDEWRQGTRWPCGADARLSADLDYRQAVRDAAERFLAATRAALARQQQATTDAVAEQGRLRGQLDAARQALDDATSACAELEAELGSVATELREARAERDEAQAGHAAAIAHALAVGEALAPSQDGQGAAPEPPPAPPVGDAPAKQATERARTARAPRTAPHAGARKAGTATEAPRDAKG